MTTYKVIVAGFCEWLLVVIAGCDLAAELLVVAVKRSGAIDATIAALGCLLLGVIIAINFSRLSVKVALSVGMPEKPRTIRDLLGCCSVLALIYVAVPITIDATGIYLQAKVAADLES